MGRKFDDVVTFDNTMLESILDDWLVESEKQSVQEDEVYSMSTSFVLPS